MADDYIRLKEFGTSNQTGYKILASLIIDFGFAKGIDTSDLSLPTSTKRLLLPTSGLKTDLDVTIELLDTGANKAFTIDNIGNETAQNKITTGEQLTFVLNNMISEKLGAVYEIYIDWLGETYSGLLTITGRATGTEYFNKVTLVARLKIGDNILGV